MFSPAQSLGRTGALMEQVLVEFADGVFAAIPRIMSAIVFLAIAGMAIKLVLTVVGWGLDRFYPIEQRLIVDLVVAIVGTLLWFAVALALLQIVGMGEVAASLGTAAGFIGLGIAFALKESIADTVAGVYLLRDNDFNHGDRVDAAGVTGTIVGLDLRKTRLRTDAGELVVLANRDVEKKWTQRPHDQPTSESNG